jgi:hypothetical protein
LFGQSNSKITRNQNAAGIVEMELVQQAHVCVILGGQVKTVLFVSTMCF